MPEAGEAGEFLLGKKLEGMIMVPKSWLDYIDLLESVIKNRASCPCCGETSICEEVCSIEEDDPNYFEEMQYMREVLGSRPAC